VLCLSVIHAKGDTRGSHQGGRDTLRKVGPHDTEGLRCTLARYSSVKNGIVIRVTQLDAFRKSIKIFINTLLYDMFMT